MGKYKKQSGNQREMCQITINPSAMPQSGSLRKMIFRFWNAGNSYSCVEKSPANHMIIIVVDG